MLLAPRAMEILDRFIGETLVVLPHMGYRPDCSVAAVRIAKTILERYHFKVDPLSVRVDVKNAPMAAKGRLPESDEEAKRWVEEDKCWMVTMGFTEEKILSERRWNGHLLAIVNDRLMMDLLLGQATNHGKGISLTALLVPVDPGFIAGRLIGQATMNGCGISYGAYPADRTFMQLPDWTVPTRHAKAVAEILRRMK